MTLREFFNKLSDQRGINPRSLGILMRGKVIVLDELISYPLTLHEIDPNCRNGRGAVYFYTSDRRMKMYSWNPDNDAHLLFSRVMNISCNDVKSVIGNRAQITVRTFRENPW